MIKLDIALPETCGDCPCYDLGEKVCRVQGQEWDNDCTAPDWCPIFEERTGHWTEIYDDVAEVFYRYKLCCSACKHYQYVETNYCSNCGAKMRTS